MVTRYRPPAMGHLRWFAVCMVACKSPAPVPLPEAILGDWETWCVNDRNTGDCLSKDRDGDRMTVKRDGTLAITGDDTDQAGHWKLTGDQLEMSLEVMGHTYGTTFTARIEHGRLVLWSGDHSEVYGRVGATFTPADSPVTTGAPVVREIQGVTYTLPLPSGYRLGEATEYREMWMPRRGEGFTVEVKIGDRGTSTCKEFGGGRGGTSTTEHDVERQVRYDIMTCLEGTNLYAACNVEHTRGYLEPSEEEAAYAMCTPLQLQPRR